MTDLDTASGTGFEPAPEGQAQPENQPSRDESGRFAPGERQQEPQERQEGADEGGGERQQMVPHQALHAAREEAKTYKERFGTLEARFNDQARQIDQMLGLMRQPPQQPKQETPPDWYQDPDAAFQHNIGQAVAPLQQSLQQQREGFSQMMAVDKFGAEAVQAAQTALEQLVRTNPRGAQFDYQRIMASPHPYGELVNWHRQQATLQRVGSDPDAFIEAEVNRRLAAMGHQPAPQSQAAQSQQQQPAGLPNMPGNFASARSTGPRGGAGNSSGPRPLSEIMGR